VVLLPLNPALPKEFNLTEKEPHNMVDSIRSQSSSSATSGVRLNTQPATEIATIPPTERDPLVKENLELNSTLVSSKLSTSPAVTLLLSKESQEKATQDLAITKLVRKANAVKEPYDPEKVEHFKSLTQDPQALNNYLETLDTNAIAATLLNNAEGSFLS
jgi:hypothetical protein